MNSEKQWGQLDRWLIEKARGEWHITAPGSHWANWCFPTGAEALAAFAKGDPNA